VAPTMKPLPNMVLAIFGPTASGKSAVAEAVAERIPAEIVSADSMQVYRDLPILTNQSSMPARLTSIWDLDHEASVGEYAELAHAAIDEILAAGKIPIVVGGTGLYFRSALAELELPPPPEPGARDLFEQLYDSMGAERAHALLAQHDAAAARRVHPNDRRRVIRALELAEAGESLASTHDRLWSGETRLPTVTVGLDVPKEALKARIEERARRMFELGVADEVARALTKPLSTTARKVIGLKEISTLPSEEAIEAVVRLTVQYAAYQRKWMRRVPGLVTLPAGGTPDEIADEVLAAARAQIPLSGQQEDRAPGIRQGKADQTGHAV
jgi:tRNA dimethylallyltransferase